LNRKLFILINLNSNLLCIYCANGLFLIWLKYFGKWSCPYMTGWGLCWVCVIFSFSEKEIAYNVWNWFLGHIQIMIEFTNKRWEIGRLIFNVVFDFLQTKQGLFCLGLYELLLWHYYLFHLLCESFVLL